MLHYQGVFCFLLYSNSLFPQGRPVKPCGLWGTRWLPQLWLRLRAFPLCRGVDQVTLRLPRRLGSRQVCCFSVFNVHLVCCAAAGLRVDWAEEDQTQGNIISVPPEVYSKGCVQDVDEGLAVGSFGKITTVVKKLRVGLC